MEKAETAWLSKAAVAALTAMRTAMVQDLELRSRLAGAGEQEIAGVLEDRFWDLYPEDEVRAAAMEAAREAVAMRADPGTYLIDSQSGKALFKLTEDMVYVPPDSFDEAGNPRRQLPMLHPRLTSGLAMTVQERTKTAELERSVPSGMEESVAHVRDPWRIVDHARARIEASGIAFHGNAYLSSAEPAFPDEATVTVGKENSDGMFQSVSFKFHRSVAYGAVLASKVAALGAKRVCFTSVEKKRGSKQTWYEVTFRYGKE
jgi:hypothetical protein